MEKGKVKSFQIAKVQKDYDNSDQSIDISLEKRVLELYLKNFKDGIISPDYCIELISRASEAEAENEILRQKVEEQEREIDVLCDAVTELQSVAEPKVNVNVYTIPTKEPEERQDEEQAEYRDHKFQPGDKVGIYSAQEIIEKNIPINLEISATFLPPMKEYLGLKGYVIEKYFPEDHSYLLDGTLYVWPGSVLYLCEDETDENLYHNVSVAYQLNYIKNILSNQKTEIDSCLDVINQIL